MEPAARRRRLVLALAAGLGLLVAVLAGLLLGGGSSGTGSGADCIRAWNADDLATAYGRHNAVSHGYEDVRVARLSFVEEGLEPNPDGECAVIFGAVELDSEPVAAGQLLRGGRWTPLSLLAGIELGEIGELQAEAQRESNARIDADGMLSPG